KSERDRCVHQAVRSRVGVGLRDVRSHERSGRQRNDAGQTRCTAESEARTFGPQRFAHDASDLQTRRQRRFAESCDSVTKLDVTRSKCASHGSSGLPITAEPLPNSSVPISVKTIGEVSTIGFALRTALRAPQGLAPGKAKKQGCCRSSELA